MDFTAVIDEKIHGLERERKRLLQQLSSREHHVDAIKEVIDTAIQEVASLPEDPEVLRRELVSVLNQVPDAVGSVWTAIASDIKWYESQIAKFHEMKTFYTEWDTEQKAQRQREQDLLQKIRSGEIQEPTKMTAMRRKPGTRPDVSLGNYRRAAKSIEGEESEE